MPFVTIPRAARDALMLIADEEREAKSDHMRSYAQAKARGFFDCLNAEYPQETVGMLVMDYDCRLAGEALFTDFLPRIAFGGSDDAGAAR